MKDLRRWLIVLLVFVLGLSLGCSKKAIRSDAVGPVSPRTESRPAEAKPEPAPETKPEAAPSESAAEREKKIQEENLREEALREKARREKAEQEEAARREAAAREAAAAKLEPVYFPFDQSSIEDSQKDTMTKNSSWLKANPAVNIRAEGHCDERGTSEYNLALGQKRAEAAKAFLEGLGISGKRISTVSYGKEKPVDPGHNEAAWAKNRRVDFIPVK